MGDIMSERINDQQIKRIHEIAFQILCDVDDYCKEHNITYFLSSGSCLGAVREHGFIPWDHDVDIMLPRKDYERFLISFSRDRKDNYKVGSIYTDDEWIRQYSKIWDIHTKLVEKQFNEEERGISIDVFPIDGLPNSKLARKIFYERTKFYFKLRRLMSRSEIVPESKFRFLKKIVNKIGGRSGSRKYAIKLNKIAKKYDFDTSKYVGVSMACHYWEKETIEKKYMAEPVFLMFEGREFPVVIGYDRYLKNLYGDYMNVPENAKQIQTDFMSNNWSIEFDRADD